MAISLTGNKGQQMTAGDELEQSVCKSCGHDVGTELCCQPNGRGSLRAGERQKQNAKRARKEQAQLEETASLRQRVIPSLEEAQTPAQIVMAKMRARVADRKQ